MPNLKKIRQELNHSSAHLKAAKNASMKRGT
jgi:hypothetical protein